MYEINQQIDKINMENKRKNPWITDFMKIPEYGKRRYQSEKCFSRIFDYYPDLLGRMMKDGEKYEDKYSQLPILIRRICDLVSIG